MLIKPFHLPYIITTTVKNLLTTQNNSMMKNMLNQITLIAVVLIVFTACDTTESPLADDALLSVKENALSDNLFNDVLQQVNEASKSSHDNLSSGTKSIMNGCASITLTPFDTINWPKTLTINFGTTNCLCNDGKNRRGIILVTLSNWYREPGSLRTISFDGYFVNDHKIEGIKTVENNGFNLNSNLSFTIIVDSAVITKPDSSQIYWSASRTREWINGEPTWTLQDDEYLISGITSGINSIGDTFAVVINVPLHVKFDCPWVMAGELTIDRQNLTDIIVDYGNGSCDALATATVNGVSYPFTMN